MRIELSGEKQLQQELKRLQRAYPEASAAALSQEGMAIMALAQRKTPVDTGRLRATGYVTPPVRDGGGYAVDLGFGTEYGVYVHEVVRASHKVGEAKFLENAVNERTAGWAERLAARIRENVAKGVGIPSPTPGISSSLSEGEKAGRSAARATKKARKKKMK